MYRPGLWRKRCQWRCEGSIAADDWAAAWQRVPFDVDGRGCRRMNRPGGQVQPKRLVSPAGGEQLGSAGQQGHQQVERMSSSSGAAAHYCALYPMVDSFLHWPSFQWSKQRSFDSSAKWELHGVAETSKFAGASGGCSLLFAIESVAPMSNTPGANAYYPRRD